MLRAATRFKLETERGLYNFTDYRARVSGVVTHEIEQDHCGYVRVEGGNLLRSFSCRGIDIV